MIKPRDTQIHNMLKCHFVIGVHDEHRYHNRDSQRLFKKDDVTTCNLLISNVWTAFYELYNRIKYSKNFKES